MRRSACLALPLLVLSGLSALAGERGTAAGIQASTLGLGAEIQGPVGDRFAVRGGANYLSLSPERTIDGIRYDADVELKSGGAVLDFFPGLGGLRVTGGFRVNGNALDLSATPAEAVTLGGTTFTPAQVGRLDGKVGFNSFAPYLGLGWQSALMEGRVLIGLDVGALYQGRPDVRLSATGSLSGSPALEGALVREADAVERDLSPLRFFPVVSLTFTYRF